MKFAKKIAGNFVSALQIIDMSRKQECSQFERNEATSSCFVICLFTVCPRRVEVMSSTGNKILSGETVYTCTAKGVETNLTYQWYVNSVAVQTGPQFNVQTAGSFILTCMSTFTNGQDTCVLNKTVNVTALGCSSSFSNLFIKFYLTYENLANVLLLFIRFNELLQCEFI
jgi:hypothetical protein